MTLKTVTHYILRNVRTGVTDPRRFPSYAYACDVAESMDARPGEWQVLRQYTVIEPEPDRV